MITQHIKIDGAEFRTWLSNMEFTAGDVRAYRFLFTFRGMETSGHRLIVKAKRADGEVITGQAVDMAEGGAQEYILPNAMYAVPGTVEFEVGLYDGSGGCATSQVIAGTVRDGFGDGQAAADDRVPLLTQLVQEASAAAERALSAESGVEAHMTDQEAHAGLLAEKADKTNQYGGFNGGESARAEEGGGAVGSHTNGGWGGFAGGKQASIQEGMSGAAVGYFAGAAHGGAVGYNTKTSDGFAGGSGAKAVNSQGEGIDAVQLGSGTNHAEKTLQFYDKQIIAYDSAGETPEGKWYLKDVGKLSSLNTEATASIVAAVNELAENKVEKEAGKGLSSNDYTDSEKQKVDIINISAGGGLSVGSSAHSRDFVGFAAGHDAIDESNNGAIQLGKGTNISDGTFQVYDYQIIDSNGHIPAERIPQMAGKVDKVSGKGLSSNDYSDADKAKLASVRSQVTFSAASGDIAVAAGVTTVVAVPLSGANITFTTPAAGEENTYHLLFSLASDSASLSFPTDVLWQNGRTPDFAAGAVYELIVTYDGTHYLGGVITYAAS